MNINKKEFFNSKENWEENRDLLFEEEENYRVQLISKYKESIKVIKDEVKTYCSNNKLTVVFLKNFIEAKYINNYLKIRIDFPDIHPVKSYSFKLSIIEENRREYFIIVKPNMLNIYVPKRSVSINHPAPKNLFESKKFIKLLAGEILSLEEKKEILSELKFVFCYYSAENENPEEDKLRHYNNFSEILSSLLS